MIIMSYLKPSIYLKKTDSVLDRTAGVDIP